VVFLPGTSFKVLHAEDGARCRVLLREIADYEVGADGQVATQPVPVDEVAAAGLERADQAWQDEQSGVPLPTGAADRFSSPPGLIATIALAEEGTES
jgi:non-canonical (house-cleaning) NTP pyrophosphatase